MTDGRKNSHSGPPFPTIGRLVASAALYLLPALVPPSPLEQSLFMMRLLASPAPGHIALPVAGVRVADLRDSWGGARSGGRRHEGVDIFAPRGTRVLAATEGIVWRLGDDRLGGRVVWTLGPGGQMHYYAHLDRYAVDLRAGDRVNVGDTLGTVGTSGNARGGPPHLHYGIYSRTAGAVNPFPLLARRPG